MEFKKYPSITNSYNDKFINYIREYGFDQCEYTVTEKVHGSNFAVYYDGDNFRIASRNRFLADDHNHYGCQKILPDLKERIINLYSDLGYIEEIVIFGEMCGGKYPHPDVKPVSEASKVQGHVWYHPDNIFYPFDMKVNSKFIPASTMYEWCEIYGFFHVKPIFVGSFDECLNCNKVYDTIVPAMFGLPKIENNVCEGNVIKPWREQLFFPNGERVIIKNKNDKFKEKIKRKDLIKKIELSKRVNKLLNELLSYATENRLNNVISKIGEVTIKDFGDVMRDLNLDIQADFNEDFKKELEYLEKNEIKWLNKSLNKESSNLVRKYFMG